MKLLDAGAEHVKRIAVERRLEPGAQVGLKDVTGRDVLQHGAEGGAVRVWCRRHLERADLVGLGLRRADLERRDDPGVALVVRAQPLQPPGAVGAAQDVVVERDAVIRLRDGAVRSGRQLLDEPAELIAPCTDPAATEAADVGRQRIEVDAGERVALEHGGGIERDQSLAVVPGAEQRDETLAAPEHPEDVERVEVEVETPAAEAVVSRGGTRQ